MPAFRRRSPNRVPYEADSCFCEHYMGGERSFTCCQLLPHPGQDGRNQFLIELAVDGEAVSHVIDLEIAGVSGMDLVDDSRDGFAVRAAHDVVSGAANDEYGLVHLLPGFAEVQGLQLLIKRGGTAILTV